MTKIQYIFLILLLIFVASLVNLFYKPWLQDIQKRFPNLFLADLLPPISTPVTLSIGSLYGVRCTDPDRCDCTTIQEAAGPLEPFDVMEGEAIYVMNRQLAPGRYCLPSGVSHCNQNTSYQIFTASGWKCVPRRAAGSSTCHGDPNAADNNQLNVLWDYLENRKVDETKHLVNLYEKIGSQWRYRCKCESKDVWGRPMVQSTPWTCSVDYCVAEFPNVLVGMGFDGSQCQCGTAVHEDPDDKTSPCKLAISEITSRSLFKGRVDCTHEGSMTKHGLFCPSGERVLRSKETMVTAHAYVEDFLNKFVAHYYTDI